jgi:hypothetical protein
MYHLPRARRRGTKTLQTLLVAREVIKYAVRNQDDVFGEVETRGDDEEGEEEEEY